MGLIAKESPAETTQICPLGWLLKSKRDWLANDGRMLYYWIIYSENLSSHLPFAWGCLSFASSPLYFIFYFSFSWHWGCGESQLPWLTICFYTVYACVKCFVRLPKISDWVADMCEWWAGFVKQLTQFCLK